MDEQLHYIDKLFKKAVEMHLELPSGKVWEGLEKNLQKRNVTSIKKKYIKWKWVAAALFIFSAGLGMYTINLVVKYKKAVEKKPASGNVNNTKNLHSNTTIAGTISNKNTLDNLKIRKDARQETDVKKIRDIQYSFNKGQDVYATNKKATNTTAIITTRRQENKEKGILNKNEKQGRKLSQTTVALIQDKMLGINKNSRASNRHFLNKTFKDAEGMVTTDNKIKSDENRADKKNSNYLASPVNKREDSKESAYPNSASIIHKNFDPSIGMARIPDTLLKDQTFVTAFPVNATSATGGTSKGYNKNKVGTVRVSIDRGKYTTTIYYSQHFVYNNIKSNNPDFKEDNYLQIKNSEKNRVANVVGFSIERNIGRNAGIETGISFQNFITDIAAKPLVARRDNNGKINYRISTSGGYAYYTIKNRPNPPLADTIHTVSSKSTIKYISVPFGLQYHFYVGKRITFNPAAILSANFSTSAKITTVQSLEHTYTGDLEGLKPHYFDGVLRLDVCYYLTKRIGISLTPSSSFGLSDATETKPVITRRNTFGLATGLNFRF